MNCKTIHFTVAEVQCVPFVSCFEVLNVLFTKLYLGWGQIAQHFWYNILFISALLNKNKEVIDENNNVKPIILSNLTPALRSLVCLTSAEYCNKHWAS